MLFCAGSVATSKKAPSPSPPPSFHPSNRILRIPACPPPMQPSIYSQSLHPNFSAKYPTTTISSQSTHLFRSMANIRHIEFEDFLPTMAERLGEEGLMEELCNGFRLLMDPGSGLITFESLKRNSALLGLDSLSDEELREMMREGDLDGDGGLSEMEFCVLMVRLSPQLMDEAWDQVFQNGCS